MKKHILYNLLILLLSLNIGWLHAQETDDTYFTAKDRRENKAKLEQTKTSTVSENVDENKQNQTAVKAQTSNFVSSTNHNRFFDPNAVQNIKGTNNLNNQNQGNFNNNNNNNGRNPNRFLNILGGVALLFLDSYTGGNTFSRVGNQLFNNNTNIFRSNQSNGLGNNQNNRLNMNFNTPIQNNNQGTILTPNDNNAIPLPK